MLLLLFIETSVADKHLKTSRPLKNLICDLMDCLKCSACGRQNSGAKSMAKVINTGFGKSLCNGRNQRFQFLLFTVQVMYQEILYMSPNNAGLMWTLNAFLLSWVFQLCYIKIIRDALIMILVSAIGPDMSNVLILASWANT